MVAKRIPTILPPMQLEESMEVTKIYSVAGMVDREHPLIIKRPFRSVHHTVTRAALIGGGEMCIRDSYATYQFWWKQGASRVVSARELSLREIKEIRERIPAEMEIESFIHGAMCISYSDVYKRQLGQQLEAVLPSILYRRHSCNPILGKSKAGGQRQDGHSH